MRKTTKILVSVGAAVVVLALAAFLFGPKLYASIANEHAGAAPTNSASAPLEDSISEFTGTATVTEGSSAGYRVDEVLRGEHVTVRGTTDQVSGDATLEAGTITAATISVDVASIATDSEQRDGYFRTEALDTPSYPTATFTLTEPATLTAGASSVTLVGTFEIHGVTQPVTFEAQLAGDGDEVQLSGSIPITFEDYGVTAPDMGFVTVEPTGDIEFALVLTLTAS